MMLVQGIFTIIASLGILIFSYNELSSIMASQYNKYIQNNFLKGSKGRTLFVSSLKNTVLNSSRERAINFILSLLNAKLIKSRYGLFLIGGLNLITLTAILITY